ncbi:unnamed protein product [Leptosia nina]|uniref:Uncharacterized protein n=1 Tax=Leptosia nina TaxID=320188 RepID=A0AAV1J5T9_9NEOP
MYHRMRGHLSAGTIRAPTEQLDLLACTRAASRPRSTTDAWTNNLSKFPFNPSPPAAPELPQPPPTQLR